MREIARCKAAMKLFLAMPLLVGCLAMPATPAVAGPFGDYFGCFFGGCFGDGGWNDEPEEETPEPADPTGVIQTVFIVGDGFFPTTVHANPGDEILFHNLRNAALRVEAVDGSWTSDAINKNFSWSFIVQEGMELEFQKWSYGYTSMRGEISLDAVPASVDFGDLIDYEGNVVGKDGVVGKTADGLGYTLADLGGTVRSIGDGLALGLTSALGLGNN